MNHSLAGLRDVEGIQGAFVLDSGGHLLGTDVPRFIGHEELRNAAPRIATLMEALADESEDIQLCNIRFESYRLFVAPCGAGWLVALGDDTVNVRALRLGLRLAARRIHRSLDGVESAHPASPRHASYPPHSDSGWASATMRPPQSTLPTDSVRDYAFPEAPGRASQPDLSARSPYSGLGDRTSAPDMAALRHSEPTEPSLSASAIPAPDASAPGPAPRGRTIVYRGRKYTVS